jgi:hypothetical protein
MGPVSPRANSAEGTAGCGGVTRAHNGSEDFLGALPLTDAPLELDGATSAVLDAVAVAIAPVETLAVSEVGLSRVHAAAMQAKANAANGRCMMVPWRAWFARHRIVRTFRNSFEVHRRPGERWACQGSLCAAAVVEQHATSNGPDCLWKRNSYNPGQQSAHVEHSDQTICVLV